MRLFTNNTNTIILTMKCKKCNQLLVWMSDNDISTKKIQSLYVCQNKKCTIKTIKITNI